MSSYRITTDCSPPQAWYKDETLYEYLSSDLFWLLGIAIVVNCWWADKQIMTFDELRNERKRPEKAEKEADKVLNEPDTVESPNSTASSSRAFILPSYITSEPRRYLAIVICSLVLPAQLLHASWVLKTAWRFTSAVLKATYPSMKPRLFGFILYSPVTLTIVVAWVAILGTGVFLMCAQLLVVLQLADLDLDNLKKSEKVTQQSEDEEWDEVEKNSEQGEGEGNVDKNKAN